MSRTTVVWSRPGSWPVVGHTHVSWNDFRGQNDTALNVANFPPREPTHLNTLVVGGVWPLRIVLAPFFFEAAVGAWSSGRNDDEEGLLQRNGRRLRR